MILHGYWRSGAAYRVRIALNLKGVAHEQRAIDLRTGAQRDPAWMARNPQGMVPALEADGLILTQSPAILEWLEETRPEPPLLPRESGDRAAVRAMAAIVACDVHPLNNLRVLTALRTDFRADADQVNAWADRWISAGFDALERLVERHGAGFCFGASPTVADVNLIPQMYSARRFGVDRSRWPRLSAVEAAALALPAFAAAHPDQQPDAD
ncbi:MAG: maleylacetoacetate isomerase [Alphaproteobacteria bacterium]|nr:maleylacetoacetate isomerase [Alphaproteobacteria bacterium]MBU1525002.1 maleylacetoacetate isomerase [Alphaproteobacteria bacterium]MBU2116936.1 maleylacetoacetate isomerase [Alphaproteobacteria bacterium]MBU2349875.1 maleylacetoacetate isomerase [Alphaproteobacteria bacterium]MBU2382468.1 maleylacetoacetate isomerase [Alphaproteobacteria bacterium]